MYDNVNPLPVNERIATLDIVRGFALLGMLIANMPGFSTSFFADADGSNTWPSLLDKSAAMVHDMLFEDKINSVFSLLFGISFTIQLGRLLEREPDRAMVIYTRRLLALLAFGLVHTIVFWNGDVLHIYALLGFGLLLLRNVSDRVVYALIGACLLYPAVSATLRVFVMTPDVVATQVLPDADLGSVQQSGLRPRLVSGRGAGACAPSRLFLHRSVHALGRARLLRTDSRRRC